jgi:hypothetical protein
MPQTEQPTMWGQVETFWKEYKLDQDEYFMLDDSVSLQMNIWHPDTWHIAIWVCEGSNEGFYLHVDEIKRKEGVKGGVRYSRALGKFWDISSAQNAANRLFRFIYGYHQEEYRWNGEPVWSTTWLGG